MSCRHALLRDAAAMAAMAAFFEFILILQNLRYAKDLFAALKCGSADNGDDEHVNHRINDEG
jgi:hypothetical protein